MPDSSGRLASSTGIRLSWYARRTSAKQETGKDRFGCRAMNVIQ